MVYFPFLAALIVSFACCIHSQQIKVIKSLEETVQPVSRSIQPNRLSEKVIRELFLNESSSFQKDSAGSPMSIHTLSSIGLGVARSIAAMGGGVPQSYEVYTAPSEYCPYAEKPKCDTSYQYRSYDGSCNNINNPWYGMVNSPYKRFIKPAYNDAINEPRYKSVTGRSLQNPRKIAMDVHKGLDEYSDKISNLLPHYAQFIAHDFSFIQLIEEKPDQPLKCYCYIDNSNCMKFDTPRGDTLNKDQECMTTPRSSASFKSFTCDLGYREQLNSRTHFLDLSQIYGHNITLISGLRSFSGGMLKSATFQDNKRFKYLPFDKDSDCGEIKKGNNCLKSGDKRLLQNLPLAATHTIWMRMHNAMAQNLIEINPYWDDERLFQEARKMCIAMYQHIIYKEFLPVLLGKQVAELYGLLPELQGYSDKYDSVVYPQVANEVITAAFRFGHSMVRDDYSNVDSKYKEHGKMKLEEIVFNTEKAFGNDSNIDTFMRTCLYNRAGKYDTHVTDFLTSHLFEDKNSDRTKRFSLPALNIMRSRDHGVASYHQYRVLCGLNKAGDFDDLYNIPKETREKLRKSYEHVDDIDLFTGGIAERPIEGGAIGATFACMLAKQFKDTKHGDRFFYEYGYEAATSLTPDQLAEIKRTSLWQILCLTLDVSSVQSNPFLAFDHKTNPLFHCDTKKKDFNYSFWKE